LENKSEGDWMQRRTHSSDTFLATAMERHL
jgi:hypothetical protein